MDPSRLSQGGLTPAVTGPRSGCASVLWVGALSSRGGSPRWLSCPPVVPPLGSQIVIVSTISRSPWDALSLAPHRAEGLGDSCSDSCPDTAYDLGSSLSSTSWANYIIS